MLLLHSVLLLFHIFLTAAHPSGPTLSRRPRDGNEHTSDSVSTESSNTNTDASYPGDSHCVSTMCLSAITQPSNSTVTYVLQSTGAKTMGWMAMGFGKEMANSPMVIMWPNSDGTVSLSQREASGEIPPSLVSNPDRTAVPLPSLSNISSAQPKLVFSIPANSDLDQNVIWAFGTDTPTSSDPNKATIEQHTDAGMFSLNLEGTSGSLSPASSSSSSSANNSSGSTGLTGDSRCGNGMCVSAINNTGNSTLTFVMQSTGSNVLGYMAVGFGTRMANSPMIIMWANGDGTVTLSQREATGYSPPAITSDPTRVATPLGDLSDGAAVLPRLSFSVPADSDTTTDIIWAFGTVNPASSSSSAPIEQHLYSGTFSLNLVGSSASLFPAQSSSASTQAQPLSSNQRMFVAHAIFMVLGFLLFLPMGALIARYRLVTDYWFKLHAVCQFWLAAPAILIGFILGVASTNSAGHAHLSDSHKRAGLALVVLYFFQTSLGAFIHWIKNPRRTSRPAQNYAHAIIGLLIVSLSFWQVHTGYDDEFPLATGMGRLPNSINVVFYLWVVIMPLAYIGGLLLLKKQFAKEQKELLRSRKPSKRGESQRRHHGDGGRTRRK